MMGNQEMLPTGKIIQRRYRIVRLLGQGGFGAVYRAWDMQMQGPCALKQNLIQSPESQSQFSREARMLFSLRHPSLPRVFDYFTEPDLGQFLVMDFIEGEDLKSMLEKQGKPLLEEQVVTWISQVCDALSYLHAQNPPIIHRDIKPANIKITSSITSPHGQAVLVDFGIAKTYDPGAATTRGARAVTLGYSPLEQYGMGGTDAQSDVYSLAATAYHLLTGQEAPASINVSMAGAEPARPINEINPNVSTQTSVAIQAAIQIERQDRTKSAALFKADLQPRQPASHGVPPISTPEVSPLPVRTVIAAPPKPASPPSIDYPQPGLSPNHGDLSLDRFEPKYPPYQPFKRKKASSQLPKWFPWLLALALLGILVTVVGMLYIALFM